MNEPQLNSDRPVLLTAMRQFYDMTPYFRFHIEGWIRHDLGFETIMRDLWDSVGEPEGAALYGWLANFNQLTADERKRFNRFALNAGSALGVAEYLDKRRPSFDGLLANFLAEIDSGAAVPA